MTTFALVMIVKNGMDDLPRTLAAVKPYVSSWTICDTGSTDGTQEYIRETLADVPGTLHIDEWRNFGYNRSLALARARGTADWLLLMDTDMAVTIHEGWEPKPDCCPHTFDQHAHEFCSKDNACFECSCSQYSHGPDAYMIEMGGHTAFSYRLPLVVRGDLPWASFGKVHEYTARADGLGFTTDATDGVTIDMLAIDRSTPEKYLMHERLLRESLAENPDNPRDVYYLAQTLSCLGRSAEAREWFLKRATMGDYDAEIFYARFRAAMLAPTWEARRDELTAAWESRPWRIEPLVALAREYNATGQHHMAYALASVIPPLNADVLFLHTDCWDWGLKFEKSIAAWWCGYPAEAKMLCDELLSNPRLPDNVREQVTLNRSYSEAY